MHHCIYCERTHTTLDAVRDCGELDTATSWLADQAAEDEYLRQLAE